MSIFTDAFSESNIAAGAIMGENVVIFKGANADSFEAISVDEIEAGQIRNPGGKLDDTSCIIYVLKSVYGAANLREGAILKARDKYVRINKTSDDGDNAYILTCGPAGVRM